MKNLIALFALTLISACPQTAYERTRQSTLSLGNGMGVFVEGGLLTAFHVAEGRSDILRADPAHDLALLDIHGLPIRLGHGVGPGDPIMAVGADFGYLSGHVRRVERCVDPAFGFDTLVISTSLPVNPGDSGSGIIHDGALVGIVSFIQLDQFGVSKGIDVSEIRAFLEAK